MPVFTFVLALVLGTERLALRRRDGWITLAGVAICVGGALVTGTPYLALALFMLSAFRLRPALIPAPTALVAAPMRPHSARSAVAAAAAAAAHASASRARGVACLVGNCACMAVFLTAQQALLLRYPRPMRVTLLSYAFGTAMLLAALLAGAGAEPAQAIAMPPPASHAATALLRAALAREDGGGGAAAARLSGLLGDAASEGGEALQHAAMLAVGSGGGSRWTLPPHARGAVLYAGVVASGLNYVLLVRCYARPTAASRCFVVADAQRPYQPSQAWGNQQLGPATVSMYLPLQPLAAALLSRAFLGTPVGGAALGGGAAILLGLAAVASGRAASRRADERLEEKAAYLRGLEAGGGGAAGGARMVRSASAKLLKQDPDEVDWL